MCAGGPPNPIQPILPHSRATVARDGVGFPASPAEVVTQGVWRRASVAR